MQKGRNPRADPGTFSKARKQAGDKAQQVRGEEEEDEANTDQCGHVRDEDGNLFAIDPGNWQEEEDCWHNGTIPDAWNQCLAGKCRTTKNPQQPA